MILKLKRHWFSERSTIGVLMVDTVHFAFTLEDVARPNGVKIAGSTCIPAGEYPVIVDFSQRFQKPMPHVMDVPMFEGIRIHTGNSSADVAGCIAVGYQHGQDLIWESVKAFDDLFAKIQEAVSRQETICLEITNEQL